MAALTATATDLVRRDIVRLLGLRDAACTVTGFDRPNLRFAVERREPKQKLARLDAFIDERRAESGIVYCAKRATVEEVCDHLRERGIAATRYHAGLTAEERERNQRAFVNDTAPVMVATNAFGMGIDKSNVSYVVHYNMPGSVEAYYQEAGRAGRDGSPAECLLLWCDGDIATGRFFIEQESTHEGLTAEEAEVVRASRRRMLESMVGYCYTTGCLRAYILRYFGEGGHDEALPSQGGATEVAPYGGAGAGGANLLDGAAWAPDSRDGHAACDPTLRRGGSWSALPTEENSASSSAKRCCSNCDGEFEAVDVTAEARAIMRCVQALRGRFGKTTVVDVLRGADTENLRQWGLVNLPVYGTSEARRALLMEVVELLAADGYLAITEGKFPLVGFGPRYREAAEPDFALRIKQTPKVRKGSAAKPPKAARPGAADLTERGRRALRASARPASAPGPGGRRAALRHLPRRHPGRHGRRPPRHRRGAAGPPRHRREKTRHLRQGLPGRDHGCPRINRGRVGLEGPRWPARRLRSDGTAQWAVPQSEPLLEHGFHRSARSRTRTAPARYNLVSRRIAGRIAHISR